MQSMQSSICVIPYSLREWSCVIQQLLEKRKTCSFNDVYCPAILQPWQHGTHSVLKILDANIRLCLFERLAESFRNTWRQFAITVNKMTRLWASWKVKHHLSVMCRTHHWREEQKAKIDCNAMRWMHKQAVTSNQHNKNTHWNTFSTKREWWMTCSVWVRLVKRYAGRPQFLL